MLSVPKIASTDNLLEEMAETVCLYNSATKLFKWFYKQRFDSLRNISKIYAFTNLQRSRYKELVNKFNAFCNYGESSTSSFDMERPLIN